MKKILILMLLLTSIGLLAQKLKFEVQWYPQAQFAGYIMAVEKGFFKAKNLDVELVFSTGATKPLTNLKQNKTQFCTAWLSSAISNNQNNSLICLGQVLQNSSLLIVSKKSANITSPEKLNNKKLSLWSGDFSAPINALINKYNIKYQKVPGSYDIEMFLEGACDAATMMYYNEYNKLYLAGVNFDELNIYKFSEDEDLNFPEDGIYVTIDFYNSNKEKCESFAKAVIKGWKYAKNNPEETVKMVLKYSNDYKLKTNYSQQKWMLNAILASLTANLKNENSIGKLKKTDYLRVANELKRQKIISDITIYEEFYKGF